MMPGPAGVAPWAGKVGWHDTAVLPLQQFWARPPLASTQICCAGSVGLGTVVTHDAPEQLPAMTEHFWPPQASSCAGTPFDSWSRHGLEPPVPGVPTVPVVGASWMSRRARN